MDHLFRKLFGYCIFSTFDLRHGYHHILIKESDRYKTAFRSEKRGDGAGRQLLKAADTSGTLGQEEISNPLPPALVSHT